MVSHFSGYKHSNMCLEVEKTISASHLLPYVVMDRASPHRAILVKRILQENRNIRIIYLPKGSPYLNAIEECWHQGKQILLVSVYYRTFADMCNAIITYYGIVRFKLDIIRYASRNPKLFCKTYDRRYTWVSVCKLHLALILA